MSFLLLLFFFLILLLCFCVFLFFNTFFGVKKNSYHTKGWLSYKNRHCKFGKRGRTINYEDVNYLRELPFGEDVFKAYWIVYNYHLGRKDEDFIGAILLKWIKDGNIKLSNDNGKVYLHFLSKPVNCNEVEEKFYYYVLQASFGNTKNGFSVDKILDSEEFKIWCQSNYSKILNWFGQILDYEIDCLIEEKKITVEKVYKGYKYQVYYNVDDSMYEDAIKLAGLKKFLNDFTIIDDRKSIEVKLFDYYLIYAILLGEADKVFAEFSELYPQFVEYNFLDVIKREDVSFIDFIIN